MTEKLFLEQTDFDVISENYKRITENINNALLKVNRKDSVRLMAVTKTVPAEKINHAISLGINLLGENRAQELLDKFEQYTSDTEIHFIGSLQTNKVKYIIDKVSMIHSLNSLKLCDEINHRAAAIGKIMDVLIEVNIGSELSKSGIDLQQIKQFVEEILCRDNVRLRGLMVIPPPCENNEKNEKYFALTEELFHNLKSEFLLKNFDTLSMGMSGDYECAIKYGSTIVRIGSLLFGYRRYTGGK